MLIRRITLAALMAALVGGTLALPASSTASPVAHASKCKKAKKGKKKKKCKCGAGQSGDASRAGHASEHFTWRRRSAASVVAVSPVLAGTGTTGLVTISDAAPSAGQPSPCRAAIRVA